MYGSWNLIYATVVRRVNPPFFQPVVCMHDGPITFQVLRFSRATFCPSGIKITEKTKQRIFTHCYIKTREKGETMCRMAVDVDEKKKDKVKAILKQRGYTMADAIDMYFDAIINDHNIPTKVGLDTKYGPYDSVADLRRALHV